MSSAGAAVWSKEEEKAFENGIAMHWVDEDSKEQYWEKIASNVPSKSMEELKQHYEMLVEDVRAIEAGHIPLPNYVGEEATSSNKDSLAASSSSEKRSNNICGYGSGSGFSGLGHGGKAGSSRQDQERRKGIPWTEEEHRYLFFFSISFHLCQITSQIIYPNPRKLIFIQNLA